jgi:hypothetical protein
MEKGVILAIQGTPAKMQIDIGLKQFMGQACHHAKRLCTAE